MKQKIPTTRAVKCSSKTWRALVILSLFLVTACNKQKQVCSTEETGGWWQRPETERWPVCSDEDRVAAGQMAAPLVPIPDSPGCTAQLLVKPDKAAYEPGEYITIVALLRVHGDCTWHIQSTFPMVDFRPIVITDEMGESVPLTDVGRRGENYMVDGEGNWHSLWLNEEKSSCQRLPIDEWFDLSASGTYTVTLVRLNLVDEPQHVPGNTVTFTRLP
jgi:hypothetical protein